MYLKRNSMPKTWPLARKGTTYVVMPKNNLESSVPLLIVLRDMLEVAGNRNEAKKLIGLKKIKVNNKIIRDERYSLSLFDVLSLDNRHFRLIFQNRKFALVEIKSKYEEKIAKIIGKKILNKGLVQANLSDGRNYLIKEKFKVGDSATVDFKENKIKQILPFKENCNILFITGKHLGKIGKVENIDKKTGVLVRINEEKLNAKSENLIVVE